MESLSNPHWEALTPKTRDAFHQMAHLSFIKSFYLAGGMGLALWGIGFQLISTYSPQTNQQLDLTSEMQYACCWMIHLCPLPMI